MVIEPDGRVSDRRLARSSGFELLDAAALDAVAAWRFTPSHAGNEPVRSEPDLPVIFVIRDGRTIEDQVSAASKSTCPAWT